MKNLVIRVYRQDEKDQNQVVGIVEHVEENRKTNFSSMDGLIRIVCSQAQAGPAPNEEAIREAINNRDTSDSGPDWGEIRSEPGSDPSKGEMGEREN